MNGCSQTIRLPDGFRFDTAEVYLTQQGDNIFISTKKLTWNDFFNQPRAFGDDFLEDREGGLPQVRDLFSDGLKLEN